MMKIKWKQLLISIAIPLAVGALSALLSRNGMAEFADLNKPALSPPAWLFPVVWTLLYTLMGIASYLVFTSGASSDKIQKALTVYGVQLGVNFFWSIIFFRLSMYLFAFIWLVLLWLLIIVTMVRFYKIKELAGDLIVPYLLWVTFAGYLNFGIYLLNR